MLENGVSLMWRHLSVYLSQDIQSASVIIEPKQVESLRHEAYLLLSVSVEELLKLENAAGKSLSYVHAFVRRIRELLTSQ